MTQPYTSLKAIIIDAEGPELTAREQELFSDQKPAGFILFQRNCVSPGQVRALVAAVRECVGRDDLPVLIDQEGGTVARLKAPAFREYPPARHFRDMAAAGDRPGACDAVRDSHARMGSDLAGLGITVNCAPVADVPAPDCHPFLAESRTLGTTPEDVAHLAEAACRGLLSAGVTPVIKHIPGHGRARTDSHFDLPVTDAPRDRLAAVDFKPFKYLAQSDMKKALWGMAAHVVYSAIDPDSAATISRKVTKEVIREEIGFDGVLVADDIAMKALGGDIESRVKATMAAGMDLTMLCNAPLDDRAAALAAAPLVTAETARRLEEAEAWRQESMKRQTGHDRTGTNA